eukprot:comp17000_c1_seq1/m.15671 comp17000_c1_seq1/g.15671  ORF comp17000_c1_seq1/g.15671 comp17000_c1_seq1/m.15671 type:complete len:331 (-) comp17000_c1_seq1:40-1032(-)
MASPSAPDASPMAVSEPSTPRPPEQAPNPPQLALRALISTKDVGAIIGRGGATIKQFREESGTRILISEAQPHIQERVMTVMGSVQGVGKAYSLIAKKLEEDAVAAGGPVPKIFMNLLAPYSQTGAIIGKGGEKVKEIREHSGAQVSISQEVLPQSTERVVTVTGSAESLGVAIGEIAACLYENPVRGPVMQYQPEARVEPPAHPPPGRGRGMPISHHGYGYSQYGGTGYGQTYGYQGGAAAQPTGPETTQVVTIPGEYVGAIIGKRGVKINEIRTSCGVRIRIADAEPDTTERKVILTGTAEGCQQACFMLNARLQQEIARASQQQHSQ